MRRRIEMTRVCRSVDTVRGLGWWILTDITAMVVVSVLYCLAPSTSGFSYTYVLSGVAPRFPADLDSCLLLEQDFGPSSSVRCGAACIATPDCALFCVNGTVCSLFQARVTSQWAGSHDLNAKTFHKCFTAVSSKGDIATAVPSSSTSTANGSMPSLAVDGYFCSSQAHCFVTNNILTPWWQVKYNLSQTVSRVIIQQDPKTLLSMEVRIGNALNSNLNSKFNASSSSPNGLFTFNIPASTGGKIITIVGKPGVMTLCLVQIIQ
nr:uncharacterized protein LOC123744985 [Procambarus clarkii]